MTYTVSKINLLLDNSNTTRVDAAHCRSYEDLRQFWKDAQAKKVYPVARLSPSLKRDFYKYNARAEREENSEMFKNEIAAGASQGLGIIIISGVVRGVSQAILRNRAIERVSDGRMELLLPRYNYRYEDHSGWLIVDFTFPSQEHRNLERKQAYI